MDNDCEDCRALGAELCEPCATLVLELCTAYPLLLGQVVPARTQNVDGEQPESRWSSRWSPGSSAWHG